MMVAMMVVLLCGWASPAASEATVPEPAPPCRTVADCWLDDDGRPIRRPKRFRGKRLPKADCGVHLLWLRNHLSCEQSVCVVTHFADRC